jgi:hypothetical protein
MGCPKKIKGTLELGFLLFYGPYGEFVMIASLTQKASHHFCRLSLWLPTRSVCGLIYNWRTSVRLWILGATVWRRLHGISTTGADGVLTGVWHVDAKALHIFSFFSMAHLCWDPLRSVIFNKASHTLFCKNEFYCSIKTAVFIIAMQWLGQPISEKNRRLLPFLYTSQFTLSK